MHRILAAGLLAAFPLLGASITDLPRGEEPQRWFPGFAAQKAALPHVVVAVDVAEFEVDGGEAYRVFVDDCRDLAAHCASTLVTELRKKSYAVDTGFVAGVGLAAAERDSSEGAASRSKSDEPDRMKPILVQPRWKTRDADEASAPKLPPPFFADSVHVDAPSLRMAWVSAMHGAFDVKHPDPKKGRVASIPRATELRAVLGADIAVFAVGLGTKNPKYRPTIPMVGGVAGDPFRDSFGRLPDSSPYPGSALRIVIVDLRDGTVLWADREIAWQGFNPGRIDSLVRTLVDAMP